MSIFVSIIAYRDAELPQTVRQLIDNADHPDQLHFGIVTQDLKSKHPNFEHIPNMKHIKMHWSQAQGAGYARAMAMDLYDGQDYFFQTDSHMLFAKGWDTDLVNMLKESQELAGTEKVILGQFPAPYYYDSQNVIQRPTDDAKHSHLPSWTSVVLSWAGVWAGNREPMEDLSQPHESHTVLGALLFAPGFITSEIPYDPEISFMGEEVCFAIRAYTRGWKMYAPNKMVCWHHYTRKNLPKVWADDTSERKWMDIEARSQTKIKDVLLGNEVGVFGIGDYQLYRDYQEMIGINFAEHYNGKVDENTQMSLIFQEVIPELDAKPESGYCLAERHGECPGNGIGCVCDCHE